MRSAILSADLRDLPFSARALLQGVYDLMREARQLVLRTGDHVTDRPGLAAKLGLDLAAIEEHLPSLLTRRLLMEDDGGALYSPAMVATEVRRRDLAERRKAIEESAALSGEVISPRVAASRANGSQGGRPRRHPVDGQSQMPLLRVMPDPRDSSPGYIVGSGLGSSPITQPGSFPDSALAKAESKTQTLFQEEQRVPSSPARAGASAVETQGDPTAKPEEKPEAQTQTGQPADVEVTARELRVIVGLPGEPTDPDLSSVRGWLANGLSPATMRGVVRSGAAGAKEPIRHLGYFKSPMAEAVAAQARGAASGPNAVTVPRDGPHPHPEIATAGSDGSAPRRLKRDDGWTEVFDRIGAFTAGVRTA